MRDQPDERPRLRNARQLAQERKKLQRRSIMLREQIAHQAQSFKPAMRTADGFSEAVNWAKANPAVVGTVLASLFVLRPKRMLSLGMKAWAGWRLASRFMPIVRLMAQVRRR